MTPTSKSRPSLASLYVEYESLREQAKALYDEADSTLEKLVRLWKKDRKAKIDEKHCLEIEDQFRGQSKAFAPGFAHRYKMKLVLAESSE